jgi:hypothetical protein
VKRRKFIAGLLSSTWPVPAWPQRAGKIARIGLLLPSVAFNGEFAQYFRGGGRGRPGSHGGGGEPCASGRNDHRPLDNVARSRGQAGGTDQGDRPRATRLAILQHPDTPVNALMRDAILPAMQKHRLVSRDFEARSLREIEQAFDAIKEWSADAVIVLDAELFFRNRSQLAAAATARRLPMACGFREMTRAGCLFSYATNIQEHFRRGASRAICRSSSRLGSNW